MIRQLSAVPPHDLFHVHDAGCTWEVALDGDESSGQVSVAIGNTLRLLPLFDAAGALVGIADSQGCIRIEVRQAAQTQPGWVAEGSMGLDPDAWVHAREGG